MIQYRATAENAKLILKLMQFYRINRPAYGMFQGTGLGLLSGNMDGIHFGTTLN